MSDLPKTAPVDGLVERAAKLEATLIIVAALIALALWTVVLWRWSRADETNAVRDLPAAERRELYAATRRTLQSLCAPTTRPAGLGDYCREQARFIRSFPDCDATCEELAQRAGAQPTR